MLNLGAFTGASKIIAFGLGGTAVFSGALLLIHKWLGRKSAQKEAEHKVSQAVTEEKINEATEEQKVITKKLQQAETASEESKKKVKDIARKAAIQMHNILKQDSIAKIDDEIGSDWGNL